jgi:hypothetical protein
MRVITDFDDDDLRTVDSIALILGLDRAEVIRRAVRLAGLMRGIHYVNGVVRPVADPRETREPI